MLRLSWAVTKLLGGFWKEIKSFRKESVFSLVANWGSGRPKLLKARVAFFVIKNLQALVHWKMYYIPSCFDLTQTNSLIPRPDHNPDCWNVCSEPQPMFTMLWKIPWNMKCDWKGFEPGGGFVLKVLVTLFVSTCVSQIQLLYINSMTQLAYWSGHWSLAYGQGFFRTNSVKAKFACFANVL